MSEREQSDNRSARQFSHATRTHVTQPSVSNLTVTQCGRVRPLSAPFSTGEEQKQQKATKQQEQNNRIPQKPTTTKTTRTRTRTKEHKNKNKDKKTKTQTKNKNKNQTHTRAKTKIKTNNNCRDKDNNQYRNKKDNKALRTVADLPRGAFLRRSFGKADTSYHYNIKFIRFLIRMWMKKSTPP